MILSTHYYVNIGLHSFRIHIVLELQANIS